MTRALLPSMIAGRDQQEKFHIMNVTSAAAFTGWKGSAAYGKEREGHHITSILMHIDYCL